MESYNDFINNILSTRGRFACGEEYHERHHIIPKCLGGNNDEDNLIDLYGREHFIAHRLLALENPYNKDLLYAWNLMAFVKRDYQERYELSPEEYEEIRKIFSHKISGINNPFYGKHHSDETKIKMSKNHSDFSGKNHPMWGKHFTEEHKDKIRQSKIGKKASEETKNKLSAMRCGKKNPRCVPIYCPELDESFWGAKEAEEKYGVNRNKISECINEKRKHTGEHPITKEKLSWVKMENKNS